MNWNIEKYFCILCLWLIGYQECEDTEEEYLNAQGETSADSTKKIKDFYCTDMTQSCKKSKINSEKESDEYENSSYKCDSLPMQPLKKTTKVPFNLNCTSPKTTKLVRNNSNNNNNNNNINNNNNDEGEITSLKSQLRKQKNNGPFFPSCQDGKNDNDNRKAAANEQNRIIPEKDKVKIVHALPNVNKQKAIKRRNSINSNQSCESISCMLSHN